MNNPFQSRAVPLNGPSKDLLPVVPDDVTDLPSVALALYIESGGAVTFTTEKGNSRTVNVADYSILPTGVRRVFATGTSATGIHAFTL